jgi:putative restriction endonuclease
MAERVFGHIPGYPEGSVFASRIALSHAGVHRPRRAGISGNGREGADSVVLAGEYENTEDHGQEILYTGQGGREESSGQQISHQELTRGNLALACNKLLGLPVRVVRGARLGSIHAPACGYRYEGLYRVADYWRERGLSGFLLWRFHLVKLSETSARMDRSISEHQPVLLRAVHETEAGRQVKALYHYRCQMCRTLLKGSAGPYAEAAYIRPREAPHNGPDALDNLLCLCPNHHILLTLGGVAIADDFTLLGQEGCLWVDFRHRINLDHVRYQRRHYWLDPSEEA